MIADRDDGGGVIGIYAECNGAHSIGISKPASRKNVLIERRSPLPGGTRINTLLRTNWRERAAAVSRVAPPELKNAIVVYAFYGIAILSDKDCCSGGKIVDQAGGSQDNLRHARRVIVKVFTNTIPLPLPIKAIAIGGINRNCLNINPIRLTNDVDRRYWPAQFTPTVDTHLFLPYRRANGGAFGVPAIVILIATPLLIRLRLLWRTTRLTTKRNRWRRRRLPLALQFIQRR